MNFCHGVIPRPLRVFSEIFYRWYPLSVDSLFDGLFGQDL